MVEKEKEIASKALDVFMRYGIKSVTMDDMARHLGMSKKTIYAYVRDKDDLVRKSLQCQCTEEHEHIEQITARGLNTIDEMFEISRFVSSMLHDCHPSIRYDLEKYHGITFKEVVCDHKKNIFEVMTSNLKRGMDEGLYRSDLKVNVITKIYMSKVELLFDAEIFPPEEVSFEELYKIMFRYHILGVASDKGRAYMKKKFDQN